MNLLFAVCIRFTVCRNLLYLKNYEGDVADLGVDFTVVLDDFGETKVSKSLQFPGQVPKVKVSGTWLLFFHDSHGKSREFVMISVQQSSQESAHHQCFVFTVGLMSEAVETRSFRLCMMLTTVFFFITDLVTLAWFQGQKGVQKYKTFSRKDWKVLIRSGSDCVLLLRAWTKYA